MKSIMIHASVYLSPTNQITKDSSGGRCLQAEKIQKAEKKQDFTGKFFTITPLQRQGLL